MEITYWINEILQWILIVYLLWAINELGEAIKITLKILDKKL